MKIIKKIAIILIITLFCIMYTKIISIAATATIITETLRLRKEPSTDSKIVDLISEDEKVEIIEANVGDDKNWYKVEYKGNTGYVYGRYIEVTNNTTVTENTNNTVENSTPTENSNEENNNVGVRGTKPRKPRKQRKHNFRKCGNT